jgi:hypothetical protein
MYDDDITFIEAGQLQCSGLFWIRADHLNTDHSYHRPVDRNAVELLKAQFDEQRVMPVVVSVRPDVSFWVCGRLETLTAQIELHGPQVEVACIVRELGGRDEEAREYERIMRGGAPISTAEFSDYRAFVEIRRERERLQKALGQDGPVQCDRLVPGHPIGDLYYLTAAERQEFRKEAARLPKKRRLALLRELDELDRAEGSGV